MCTSTRQPPPPAVYTCSNDQSTSTEQRRVEEDPSKDAVRNVITGTSAPISLEACVAWLMHYSPQLSLRSMTALVCTGIHTRQSETLDNTIYTANTSCCKYNHNSNSLNVVGNHIPPLSLPTINRMANMSPTVSTNHSLLQEKTVKT
jgi:hypothetical protein